MGSEKLISIEPQELKFRFVLGKYTYCTIRLSNNSRDHVAFKVMNTNPKNYCVRPNNGVLLPRSRCDVEVKMRTPKVAPSDMQCKDKFLIKSVVASPHDTAKSYLELFNEEGRVVESCELRVVYEFSSNQQSSNSERSAAGSSVNASTLVESNSNETQFNEEGHVVESCKLRVVNEFSSNQQSSNSERSAAGSSVNASTLVESNSIETQRQEINGGQVGDLFIKGITIVLLCLIFGYLIMKMLPLIWSLTFMITMLVIKMTKKLVSDSVEDWVVKTLLYLSIHFLSVLFKRRQSRPNNES